MRLQDLKNIEKIDNYAFLADAGVKPSVASGLICNI